MNVLPLIKDYIRRHSGLDAHRHYLGMSSIADCPVQLYLRYKQGMVVDDAGHRNAYRGYLFEREVKKILVGIGFMKPHSERELIAPFDARYKGHTDGESVEGNLSEIKSVSKEKFEIIKDSKKLFTKHYFQTQIYMKHGNYEASDVTIVVPETFEFMMLRVRPNYKVQNDLEEKAKSVLMHIDANRLPLCACGRCNKAMAV